MAINAKHIELCDTIMGKIRLYRLQDEFSINI